MKITVYIYQNINSNGTFFLFGFIDIFPFVFFIPSIMLNSIFLVNVKLSFNSINKNNPSIIRLIIVINFLLFDFYHSKIIDKISR